MRSNRLRSDSETSPRFTFIDVEASALEILPGLVAHSWNATCPSHTGDASVMLNLNSEKLPVMAFDGEGSATVWPESEPSAPVMCRQQLQTLVPTTADDLAGKLDGPGDGGREWLYTKQQ
jgi:hypothetical protein